MCSQNFLSKSTTEKNFSKMTTVNLFTDQPELFFRQGSKKNYAYI